MRRGNELSFILRKIIIQVIKEHPEGIRYTNLLEKVRDRMKQNGYTIKDRSIGNAILSLRKDILNKKQTNVFMPQRGLFVWHEYHEEKFTEGNTEENFYEPLANYLVNVLRECTNAVSLGGKLLQDKWSTPDVIGVYRPSMVGYNNPPLEFLTVEIKTSRISSDLITAFGQACSYKLFSHKVYLAIPKQASREIIDRLEALCIIFGIGLILFNPEDRANPEFEIKTRAQRSEPHYFYLNKFLERLPKDRKKILFG